jgi:hypothetical protein
MKYTCSLSIQILAEGHQDDKKEELNVATLCDQHKVVRLTTANLGIEPKTFVLSARRSDQLS